MDKEDICSNRDSDFLIVAHQIQSPLSAVKWTLSMLANGDVGELTPDQKSLVEKAFASNDRAIHLIEEVLSANRLESDRVELSLSSVPILDVVHNSLLELSPVAKDKHIKIDMTGIRGENPLVLIDREKIRNAFENILDNAIKYTMPGGVVTIRVTKEESDVLVSVEDTGIGISETDEKFLFNKFYRGETARKAGISGTGLGLFIARGIIEKHGGKMWFEDKRRDLHVDTAGVRFSFTIPLKDGEKML